MSVFEYNVFHYVTDFASAIQLRTVFKNSERVYLFPAFSGFGICFVFKNVTKLILNSLTSYLQNISLLFILVVLLCWKVK